MAESMANGSASVQAHLDPSAYKNIVLRWMKGGDRDYNPAEVLQSITAIDVLKELSVGGALMRGAQSHAAIRNYHSFINPKNNTSQRSLTF